MRVAVVGASSGLGRCLGIGLGQRGHHVALLARRRERLDDAVAEIGDRAHAVECDVTDEAGCRAAIDDAAARLGGIDALVYATGIGILRRIEELDAETWTRSFATNVIGANTCTAAALPHLRDAQGTAIYLSSISASMTPPWPGLAAYLVSKTALDKLVDAWRVEHSDVGFTRLAMGDCGGGDGDGATEFASDWDRDLTTDLVTQWYQKGYVAGSLIDVEELVNAVDAVISLGKTAVVPSLTVFPRIPKPDQSK